MPITVHPDIWALNFGQYFLVFQKVFNIYDYLFNLPTNHPLVHNYGTNFYTYPPLAYFLFGLFGFILKPFYNSTFTPWLMINLSQVYGNQDIFRQLFLLKLPYLPFDLSITFLLADLFKEKRQKKLAFLFWLFNPLTFYTTYMIGQFDILAVFCVILSLWLAQRGKDVFSVLILGLGGAIKMFPLLFLLPLVLVLSKHFKRRIWLLFMGFLPYLATIAPFLSSTAFRQVALFSNQSEKMLFARIGVSGAESIYLFVFFYLLVCFFTDKLRSKRDSLWISFYAVLLVFFSLTHYHPQWFSWIAPFLIIDLAIYGKKHFGYLTVLFFCYLVILAFFEPSLHVGLFAPVFPGLAKISGGLDRVVSRFYDPFQLKSLARSVFAAVAFFLVYLNFHHEQTKKTT